jgi:hypothetical protein
VPPGVRILVRGGRDSDIPDFLSRGFEYLEWHATCSRGDNKMIHNAIMIRTQISLTAEEMKAARAEAKRLGISLAELLRRSLRTLLPADRSKPWMRYAGLVESGDPNASQRIDDVIYGQKT